MRYLVFRSGAPTCVLDSLAPPLHLKVQSAAPSRPFWTSSRAPATLKSNLPLFLAPFGLPRASPPLQRPIRHSCSLLLDFLVPPLLLKVQSAAFSRSFWTSSCLPATSKSNPPLLLAPFGLPRASPLPQSPIRHSYSPHHAKKADCKAIRQSQSANLIPPISFRQSHSDNSNQPA